MSELLGAVATRLHEADQAGLLAAVEAALAGGLSGSAILQQGLLLPRLWLSSAWSDPGYCRSQYCQLQ